MLKFVLVHGGWHGGWCWRPVARLLEQRGHMVYTPTLTGLGERAHLLSGDITLETHIADILGVLAAEELDEVILVGHSAGAVPVAGAADRAADRVRSLIFLDGVLLHDGESLRTSFSPQQEQMFQASLDAGETMVPAPPAAAFDVPEGLDAEWVNRRLTPMPIGIAASPLRLAGAPGESLRCAYIACTRPVHPFVQDSHQRAQQQSSWSLRELDSGHDAMITKPDAVAALLQELA